MEVYAFWNNKGGTGKTSLAFQTICRYAQRHTDARVLALDVCPQANLSELLLGGIAQRGSDALLRRQGELPRATVGGYFQLRLPAPFGPVDFAAADFITTPSAYNAYIPANVRLLCGDPLLELQSNAMSTLANAQIPGTDTWAQIISWLRDFLRPLEDDFDAVFIDANPSFSIYTQIALAAADRLILPVMADDSSRRAIQNAFSLTYGLRLPSEIYAEHAYATKLREAGIELPKVHLVVKNRLTQYMGPASAYAAVLRAIREDIERLLETHRGIFTFANAADGLVDVRDFQTTGVVSFARGCPFYELQPGRLEVLGRRIQVNRNYIDLCTEAIDDLVDRLPPRNGALA